ncbi:MAG: delta-aminolevulinic acid dehydratase [Halieaceae bacterium]|nr:delta-aminolevulinic acid dehydratase [Halieaceae bacterium]
MHHLCAVLAVLASAAVQGECECLWQGSFSDVQAATNLVVSGVVSKGKGNAIDLAVKRLLRGEEDHQTIRVWLKTGDLCRPEAEHFPVGSQWLMALHRINDAVAGGFNPHTPNISYGRVGDYSLSSCGGYWLAQNEEWVSGNLVQAPRWAREPEMTPVLIDLVADFVAGKVDAQTLLAASKQDPAVRELMLDTRSFLREQE